MILHYNLTSRFGQFLKTLPITNEHYKPTFWCFESRIQTIFASILRSTIPDITYKREVRVCNCMGRKYLFPIVLGTYLVFIYEILFVVSLKM